jgi:hypothetical protein
MAPKASDHMTKANKPTPDNSSTDGGHVSLLTTGQQIMMGLKSARAEGHCFSINMKVFNGLIIF